MIAVPLSLPVHFLPAPRFPNSHPLVSSTPAGPWSHIALDFVTGLPASHLIVTTQYSPLWTNFQKVLILWLSPSSQQPLKLLIPFCPMSFASMELLCLHWASFYIQNLEGILFSPWSNGESVIIHRLMVRRPIKTLKRLSIVWHSITPPGVLTCLPGSTGPDDILFIINRTAVKLKLSSHIKIHPHISCFST